MLFRKLFGRNNQQNEDSASSQPEAPKDYWTQAMEAAELEENSRSIPAVAKVPEDELAEAEAELQELKIEMEKIAAETLAASSPIVSSFYKKTAERHIIVEQSRITEKLGDKLPELKADVNRLVENAAQLTSQTLGRADRWWNSSLNGYSFISINSEGEYVKSL